MIQPAEILNPSPVPDQNVVYEQPLGERLRTFLRLEFLFQQLLYHTEQPSEWASRAAVTSVLDIIAILTRGDVRGEVLKELERQIYIFDRYRQLPGVDQGRVQGVLRNLQNQRKELSVVGPQYLQPARESEFLNTIRHRSAIPGGTCEFDTPDYSHWLRQPYAQRLADLRQWTAPLTTLCNGVAELLWLLRQGGEVTSRVAANGVYQHTLGRDVAINLLRISLPPGTPLYPEISASHRRFTVRFMRWGDVQKRPAQISRDVRFELRLC